ncbi:flagellar assembly protein FliX [Methylobacterium radiodurans]|uniref:Flagellar assembly protein fliX n=1 Tax=Methylobacterium radiodurans TaxID=2202828 RepID=A0A2U8VX03_9HYPH|nr:flagellar assembly protein FliX [Methylobacterium radiodurans]AWN38324.1 flagellar assembly protein fliX [Methylobacterium radiodurans]
MRVDPRTGLPALSAPATTRRAEGAARFNLEAHAGAARAGATAGTAGAATLAGLDAVLMLQTEADTPQERRRRSVRRGHDLLDGLDRLKAALLGGRVAAQDLRAIAGRLAERSSASGDPRLDGLMAEIELRAAVELAKLERRPAA